MSQSITLTPPTRKFYADEPPLFTPVRPCDYCRRFVNTGELSLCVQCYMKQEMWVMTLFCNNTIS